MGYGNYSDRYSDEYFGEMLLYPSLDPPNPLKKGEPSQESWFEVPLFKGDLGGSNHDFRLVQRADFLDP